MLVTVQVSSSTSVTMPLQKLINQLGFSQDTLSKFKYVLFINCTISMWLALIDMQNDKWQIIYQTDTYEGWQNAKMANYVSIWHIQKKGCKWDDMPIHIHYLYITCLTLLSWLMISSMIIYIMVNIFQNAHIAAYVETHAYIPPKVFIQSWINFT